MIGTLHTDRLRSARNGVYAVFALNGMVFASWASRIPDAKHTLDLSPGQLGLTLLFSSAGSLIGLPAAGRIAHRLGAARACALGMLVMGVGLIGTGIGADGTNSRLLLALGLFVLGLGLGVCDVAMNLEGATVERALGVSIMPRFHAGFSGGTVLAALIGAGMSAAGIPIWAHLGVAAVIFPLAGYAGTRPFLPRTAEAEPPVDPGEAGAATQPRPRPAKVASAWTEPRTILIGVVTLVAAFTEGTANDWVSVAFVEGHEMPAWAGVLAFATFLSFMTLGRLVGTGLLDRYGRVPVLRVMFVLAVAGSLLVVFGAPVLAYAGAALWGVGVALGFPVGMSAAADDPERAPARVATVATIGYLAFITGPPLLGFLGDHVGVLHALLAVGALVIVALIVLPAVREQRPLADAR